MVSRSISELECGKRVEAESGPCCAISILEDMIPFNYVSAGVWTAVWGGFLVFPKLRNDGWELAFLFCWFPHLGTA